MQMTQYPNYILYISQIEISFDTCHKNKRNEYWYWYYCDHTRYGGASHLILRLLSQGNESLSLWISSRSLSTTCFSTDSTVPTAIQDRCTSPASTKKIVELRHLLIMCRICPIQERLSHRNSHFQVIHARNNGTTGLCNPLLGNGSVNTLYAGAMASHSDSA
jgi:hypothetical protein